MEEEEEEKGRKTRCDGRRGIRERRKEEKGETTTESPTNNDTSTYVAQKFTASELFNFKICSNLLRTFHRDVRKYRAQWRLSAITFDSAWTFCVCRTTPIIVGWAERGKKDK